MLFLESNPCWDAGVTWLLLLINPLIKLMSRKSEVGETNLVSVLTYVKADLNSRSITSRLSFLFFSSFFEVTEKPENANAGNLLTFTTH